MPTLAAKTRLQFIEETLRDAAAALKRRTTRKTTYSDVKGYLAEADLLVHDHVAKAVHAAFPDEELFSEEAIQTQRFNRGNEDSAIWVLDPICGTTNYVRGIPMFAISLCAAEPRGVAAAGIYHPPLDELFLADKNQSTLNGDRIRVSSTGKLEEAVIAVNCNQSACQTHPDRLTQLVRRLAPPIARRVKIIESANLELAYVACGRLDGYASPDDKIWDIAAGSLLIASAGGRLETYEGDLSHPLRCRGAVAANARLFDHFKSIMTPGIQPL